MENYNDLVLSYYAAVDSKNECQAEKLLAELLEVVKNDGRVLAQIAKYEIDYHGKADVLAEVNVAIWKTSKDPKKRWDPVRGAKFSTWITRIARNKADDYSDKLIRNRTTSLDPIEPAIDDDRRYRRNSNLWDEKVTAKAWERLNPDQQHIINMKREGIKGEKIAEDLGWDPSKVTKEKKKAIKLIKASSDELGSFNRGDFYEIMFVNVSLMVRSN
jgi:RNA polymerase sigma factor (sigma-70 family)